MKFKAMSGTTALLANYLDEYVAAKFYGKKTT